VSDLTEMWAALERYQPYADKAGHGETWKRMTTERTEDAVYAAAMARGAIIGWWKNGKCGVQEALWNAEVAAAVGNVAARDAKHHAARAIEEINRAMEVQP